MRARSLLLVALGLSCLLAPTAEAGWIQQWVGYQADLELDTDAEGISAKDTAAASFPNGYSITSWFCTDCEANALLF